MKKGSFYSEYAKYRIPSNLLCHKYYYSLFISTDLHIKVMRLK